MRYDFPAFFRSCSIFCIAFLLCGLLLTGCRNAAPAQTIPTDTIPASTGNVETSAPTEESAFQMDDSAYAALVSLRQAMIGTPQGFAVAYFGYVLPDGDSPVDPFAAMNGVAPQLCENLPFLLQISAENVVGTDGNLFCVVPADGGSTVAVNRTPWDEATKSYKDAEVLYRSETGDPFLLMTTNTSDCMETEVVITDSQGNVTIWYPFIDEGNRIGALCNDEGISLYYDFSPYDRLNYEDLIGGAPIEMVGSWERTWTEVEGDRVKSTPGVCTIEITSDGTGFFWISYKDKEFPEDNYTDRELIVSTGELYPDCGNNQWFAEVYTAEATRIKQTVTLLEDDTLLMQCSWEMDGMPMVSTQWFARSK